MLDPNDPDTAFVIPEKSMEYHYPPDGRLTVYQTRDAGRSWQSMSDGLPERAWTTVLREGFRVRRRVALFRNAKWVFPAWARCAIGMRELRLLAAAGPPSEIGRFDGSCPPVKGSSSGRAASSSDGPASTERGSRCSPAGRRDAT